MTDLLPISIPEQCVKISAGVRWGSGEWLFYAILKTFNIFLDLDECILNSHSCDANALCTNTHGSHNCACKTGFSGDGRSCAGNIFLETCQSYFMLGD